MAALLAAPANSGGLTTQIAETIQKVIEPQGVGVVIEARHLCMMMRGVESSIPRRSHRQCSACSAMRKKRAQSFCH